MDLLQTKRSRSKLEYEQRKPQKNLFKHQYHNREGNRLLFFFNHPVDLFCIFAFLVLMKKQYIKEHIIVIIIIIIIIIITIYHPLFLGGVVFLGVPGVEAGHPHAALPEPLNADLVLPHLIVMLPGHHHDVTHLHRV